MKRIRNALHTLWIALCALYWTAVLATMAGACIVPVWAYLNMLERTAK